MPWFKIDDAFHGHPKVMELSPAAVGIWTLSGTWCANYLTDGEIKAGVVTRFGGTPDMIQELVEAGLWIERNGAYHFKDWEDYQPMKADVEAEREAARERMRAARAKKKGVETSAEPPKDVRLNKSGTSEEVRVTPSLPVPALPVPSHKQPSSPAALSKEFESFWEHYPKKVGKIAAKKAFEKALTLTEVGNIQQALRLLHQEVRGKDQQFIPHPATWLNQGRWDDEVAPQKQSAWTKEFHNG